MLCIPQPQISDQPEAIICWPAPVCSTVPWPVRSHHYCGSPTFRTNSETVGQQSAGAVTSALNRSVEFATKSRFNAFNLPQSLAPQV